MILEGQKISYQLENGKYMLKDVHLSVEKGQKVGIVGANGSGKTTFLKCLTGSNKKFDGQILLMDQELSHYNKNELAQNIGVMHQLNDFPFDFTVKEMIEMGRYPYFENKIFLNKKDEEIISFYLDMLGLTDKKDQFYSHLSGGEKQKVLLGRALTQTPELLVLDEPTNHLDMYQQRNILKLIQELNITTLCVLHDLSLAYEFCDVIYMLKEGKVAYYGETKEVLTPNTIADVFGMSVDIIYSDKSNKTHLVAI